MHANPRLIMNMSEKDEKSGKPPTINPQVQVISPASPPPQSPVLQVNLTNIQASAFLPAAEMQALGQIDPSFPERIMKLTEATIAHNHAIQIEQLAQSRMVIESQDRANLINSEAHKRTIARQILVDVFGFTLMFVFIGGSFWAMLALHDALLLKVFMGGVATVAIWIWGKRKLASKHDHHQPASK